MVWFCAPALCKINKRFILSSTWPSLRPPPLFRSSHPLSRIFQNCITLWVEKSSKWKLENSRHLLHDFTVILTWSKMSQLVKTPAGKHADLCLTDVDDTEPLWWSCIGSSFCKWAYTAHMITSMHVYHASTGWVRVSERGSQTPSLIQTPNPNDPSNHMNHHAHAYIRPQTLAGDQ